MYSAAIWKRPHTASPELFPNVKPLPHLISSGGGMADDILSSIKRFCQKNRTDLMQQILEPPNWMFLS